MKMTYRTAPGTTIDEKLENWLEATGKVISCDEVTNEGGTFSLKKIEAANGIQWLIGKINGKTVNVCGCETQP